MKSGQPPNLRAILHVVFERVLTPSDPSNPVAVIARGQLIDTLVEATEIELLLARVELKRIDALASAEPAGNA